MDLKNKIFIYAFIISIVAGMILMGIFTWGWTFYPTALSTHIHQGLNYKKSLAANIQGRKIMLIAGSSTFFGISAKQIEDTTGIKTINMAETIQLGIKYMLYYCKPYLNSGDIFILNFEYETYNGSIDGIFSNYLACYDTNYLKKLRVDEIATIAEKVFSGGLFWLSNPERTREIRVSVKDINANGDMTSNRRIRIDKKMRETLRTSMPLGGLIRPFEEQSDVWQELEAFIKWAKAKKIVVLASWPNTIYFDEYKQGQAADNISKIKNFYKKHNVPILGEPYDFMYPYTCFFDSSYHLHDEAVQGRTGKLLKYLKPYL